MYAGLQNTNYGPMDMAEKQEKWAEHMKMEQMHRDAVKVQGGLVGASIKPHDPRGPLESAIDSVANGIQEAFSALDRLAEGLHLVLQPEMPSPVGTAGNASAQMPTSPAVSRLHSLRDQLEALNSRMNAVRCRLDA